MQIGLAENQKNMCCLHFSLWCPVLQNQNCPQQTNRFVTFAPHKKPDLRTRKNLAISSFYHIQKYTKGFSEKGGLLSLDVVCLGSRETKKRESFHLRRRGQWTLKRGTKFSNLIQDTNSHWSDKWSDCKTFEVMTKSEVGDDGRWASPPERSRSATATSARARSAMKRKRTRLGREFIFDNLWGIPGGKLPVEQQKIR